MLSEEYRNGKGRGQNKSHSNEGDRHDQPDINEADELERNGKVATSEISMATSTLTAHGSEVVTL